MELENNLKKSDILLLLANLVLGYSAGSLSGLASLCVEKANVGIGSTVDILGVSLSCSAADLLANISLLAFVLLMGATIVIFYRR